MPTNEDNFTQQQLDAFSALGIGENHRIAFNEATDQDEESFMKMVKADRKQMKAELKTTDWREAAKDLSNAIVEHPNLYGIYTIYEEIEKIVRIVDPTIPEPKIITP